MSATQDLIATALTAAGSIRWQYPELSDELREACARAMVQPAAPDMAEVRPGMEGWKAATIAWAVCASIHREYAKKKDPFFTTRQADFVRHEEAARAKALAPALDMTEVERLLEAYDREYASGGSVEDYDRARTALLDYVRGVIAERDALIAAHAGATKKMARDERQLFESWIVRECGPGETKRWLNTEVYENMRVNDYRTGWVACLGLMSAAPQPVSAAEVPMPKPDCVTFSRTPEGFGVRVDAMRMDSAIRYGEQCRAAGEAAGYARGLVEGRERCAVEAWMYYMDTCKRNGIGPDVYPQWCCAAALRGEGKP